MQLNFKTQVTNFCIEHIRAISFIAALMICALVYSLIAFQGQNELAKEIKQWNEFLQQNECKLVGKKDMGPDRYAEYSFRCRDGVIYSKKLPR